MKKYFGWLLVFALLLFVPTYVFAEEAYEYFDFVVDKVDGANIKNASIKIFASTASDPDNLSDRTNEFTVSEKIWSVCVENDCFLSEEVSDDAVFEAEKNYVLMIRIVAKNGADINVWGTDKAKYNGTPIEELDGEFGNTGTELMIKTKTTNNPPLVISPNPTEEEPIDILTPPEVIEKECTCSLALCCTTILNISLCIWLLILIVIIILIIVVCVVKNKKKKQE